MASMAFRLQPRLAQRHERRDDETEQRTELHGRFTLPEVRGAIWHL